MKIGIRKRLFSSFILLAVIPVAVIMISLVGTFSKLENQIGDNSRQDPAEKVNEINAALTRVIEENYSEIEDYDFFYQKVQYLVSEYGLRVQVVDKQGILLFDSQDKEAAMKPADESITKIADSIGQDPVLSKFFLYGLPIKVDGQDKATALVRYDTSIEPFNVFVDVIKGIIFSVAGGLFFFVMLIVLFTWYISRTILRPLEELNTATERIAKGDLDFNIRYTNNDELGNFANSFESMRIQLKESLQKQKFLEKARKEMVASISHDLRTPISSIQGYVEGLIDGMADDEETRKRYLQVIQDKTCQMNRQIEDLFEFSRLDAGQLRLKVEQVNSVKVLEKIVQSVELGRGENDPIIVLERPLPEVQIKVDPQRLEQVMMNLLGNAFRYLPQNGVVVVKAWADKDNLTTAVADNGPGISQQDLPFIFDSFYRGDKSRSRKSGGSGLGLAICKYIVEAHGGRIWAESKEGEGSTFYFSLPVWQEDVV